MERANKRVFLSPSDVEPPLALDQVRVRAQKVSQLAQKQSIFWKFVLLGIIIHSGVLLAISLPLRALHLQPLGCLGVHHDGQRGLPRAGVLQDREAGQLAGLSAGVVVETIADFLPRLPVETPLGTTKNTETWHGLRQRLRETPRRDISG